MTDTAPETRTVVMERDYPYPPERVWRALTEPHLIGEWLMKTDFVAEEGRAFTLTGDWGSVEGKVLSVEPQRQLSYTWEAMGLESVVTWWLTPTDSGTHLRMEQEGFRADQTREYQGAQYGWGNFLDQLGQVLEREA